MATATAVATPPAIREFSIDDDAMLSINQYGKCFLVIGADAEVPARGAQVYLNHPRQRFRVVVEYSQKSALINGCYLISVTVWPNMAR